MCFVSVYEHVRACDRACVSYCPAHTKTLLLIRFPAVWTWRAIRSFDSQECLVCNSTGKPQLPTHTYFKHTHTHTYTYAQHLQRHPTPLSRGRHREGPHPKRKNGSNSTADRKNTEQRGKSGGTDVNFCHTIPTPTTFSPCFYCG